MKKETKRKIKWISVVLFMFYLILLTYFLFFAESYGRVLSEREYSYNLQPLKEIKRFWIYREQLGFFAVFTNIIGNVLCFVPFGAIFPVLNRKTRHFVVIVLLSFQFSLIVECIQLISKVGSFDVDDLLLNTIGGMIGYLVFCVCNRVRRNIYG
ncbi:VanZ family protein [Robinsoniella peoriensis]|uniref:VanZ family protein n=1 Tax=Robinsoniella peoriensis TaxID=180332 RepID=UPI00085C7596|nr:VanZ family protein [Robinsoniella peoriensis]